MDKPHRFSGTNITVMVVAICLALIATPVAVAASTGSFVNITDPVTATYKARVSAKGSLVVSPRDAVTGYNAKVDSLGRQQVAGTVNTVASGGTQAVAGTVTTRSGLPGLPFAASGGPSVTVPTGKHLVIQTLGLETGVTTGKRVIAWVTYTCGGTSITMYVPLTYLNTNTDDFYGATTEVHLYADPGTTVSIDQFSADGTVYFNPQITVSGYLV